MLQLDKGSIRDAHRGPLNCVETVPGGEKVVSAGVDGTIKIWLCHSSPDRVIELAKSFSTHHQHSMNPAVQSVSISYNKARAVVGTRGGDIGAEASGWKSSQEQADHIRSLLGSSGLAAHPNDNNLFATTEMTSR